MPDSREPEGQLLEEVLQEVPQEVLQEVGPLRYTLLMVVKQARQQFRNLSCPLGICGSLRRCFRVGFIGLLLGGAFGMSGCAKPLLSPREPRSQYSRYDLVRNQYAPQYLEDEFGRRIPNLRGRLLETN